MGGVRETRRNHQWHGGARLSAGCRARDACERPNNRTFLEKVLGELAGVPLTIKTETRAGLTVEKIAREETKPEPKVDPMEAFKNDPLIQKALAEFKAEILPA